MTKRKIIGLVIFIVLIGLGMQGVSLYKNRVGVSTITRPIYGDEENEVIMEVEGDGKKTEISFEVSGQRPKESEINKMLEEAKIQAEREFLGKNKNYDSITSKVNLQETYCDGEVIGEWHFEPEGIIRNDGTLYLDELSENQIVMCEVSLTAYEKCCIYSFPVVVKKPDVRTLDGFRYFLEKALDDADKNNVEDEEVTLPKTLQEVKLKWREPISYTGMQICFIGLIGGVLLIAALKFDEGREKEKRKRSFMKDYPDIINALVLYMGTGMSIQVAFQKIGLAYQKNKKRKGKCRPAYEAILEMNRGLRDGKDMQVVLERFGQKCEHPAYQKLALLLIQNMRKGNEYLLEQLEREEKNSYETEQRRLKIVGEEASTKLLLPLGGLLIMVMIVLVMPALAQIQV
ncbi:MAG: hypothetical protein K6F30_05660 [Lachnospiraceae bacterium]|nr:hypothetical protein [Lachnospiraceae bacterium]